MSVNKYKDAHGHDVWINPEQVTTMYREEYDTCTRVVLSCKNSYVFNERPSELRQIFLGLKEQYDSKN